MAGPFVARSPSTLLASRPGRRVDVAPRPRREFPGKDERLLAREEPTKRVAEFDAASCGLLGLTSGLKIVGFCPILLQGGVDIGAEVMGPAPDLLGPLAGPVRKVMVVLVW